MRLITVTLLVYFRLDGFSWRNGRGCVPTTPNWHFTSPVRFSGVSSVDCLINSAHWKHAVVLLSEGSQIGWFCLKLRAQGNLPPFHRRHGMSRNSTDIPPCPHQGLPPIRRHSKRL